MASHLNGYNQVSPHDLIQSHCLDYCNYHPLQKQPSSSFFWHWQTMLIPEREKESEQKET